MIIVSGLSHVGLTRAENQDNFVVFGGIVAVADGMGGHDDGARASKIAVDVFEEQAKSGAPDDTRQAIREAHMRVCAMGGDGRERGMGTTGVVAHMDREKKTFSVSWSGDSRMYLLRQGVLQQLTHDHSVVQELVDGGFLSPEEALTDKRRHIITHAIGVGSLHALRVDTVHGELRAGDVYILCTDGLTNEVEDIEIQHVCQMGGSAGEMAEKLVGMALDNGGRDNVTVVIAVIS